jgi:hypothetical protein
MKRIEGEEKVEIPDIALVPGYKKYKRGGEVHEEAVIALVLKNGIRKFPGSWLVLSWYYLVLVSTTTPNLSFPFDQHYIYYQLLLNT